MKQIGIIALLAATIISSPASADFYRYVDQHGNVIFTDDLSKVPVEQRTKAKQYDDTGVIPPYETEIDEPDASIENQQVNEKTALEKDRKALEATKNELDNEFKLLLEENNSLKKEQKAAVTPDQIRAVNKKVVSFNTRFQAYQEKDAAYKIKLEAYNKRVNEINQGTGN